MAFNTAGVWAWSAIKIPALFFVRPRIVELSENLCIVRIPLRRRTKNHLGSMYFGVLAIGADTAGGLIAMDEIRKSERNVSLIFKDFHAEFLKRAMGDVHFTSSEGEEIRAMVHRVIESGERETMPVEIVATCPSIDDDPVARFTLGLSLKAK